MLLLLLSLPTLLLAANNSCSSLLKSAGASDNFGPHVGHAIHSLSLRTLRKFEPSVTENNRVPTINMDLQADDAVLPYAPDRRGPSSDKFHSEGMKVLDEVLSHMDSNSYDIKFFSTLEKVVHAFHMEEMWMMALHQYQKLKTNPPSSEVCKCAMDMENNGIMKMIRFSALAIREPMLIYGGESKSHGYHISYNFGAKPVNDQKGQNEVQKKEDAKGRRGYNVIYNISGRKKRSTETGAEKVRGYRVYGPDQTQNLKTSLNSKDQRGYFYPQDKPEDSHHGQGHDHNKIVTSNDNNGYPIYKFGGQKENQKEDDLLLTKDQAMPKLVDAASWAKWKDIAKMNPQEDYDTALFLYCALH